MLKIIKKSLKDPQSYISMALGLLVVLVSGMLIFNYVSKSMKAPTTPEKKAAIDTKTAGTVSNTLPTTHTVSAGESLWVISQKYYNSGYNWVSIAKENKLSDPGNITSGQKLVIPTVAPIMPEIPTQIVQNQIVITPTIMANQKTIETGSYTVQSGDDLWDIALRAYGDGYAWVKIAQNNHLLNPNLIHPGNVLTIPH